MVIDLPIAGKDRFKIDSDLHPGQATLPINRIHPFCRTCAAVKAGSNTRRSGKASIAAGLGGTSKGVERAVFEIEVRSAGAVPFLVRRL